MIEELLNKWRKFRQALCWKAGGKNRGLHCINAINMLSELCGDCIHNKWREDKCQAEEKIKYAKGGVVEPLHEPIKIELEEEEIEIVIPLDVGLDCLRRAEEEVKEKFEKGYTIQKIEQKEAETITTFDKLLNAYICELIQKREELKRRQNTNNWRKMHGLPMRRKAGRKKNDNKRTNTKNRKGVRG